MYHISLKKVDKEDFEKFKTGLFGHDTGGLRSDIHEHYMVGGGYQPTHMFYKESGGPVAITVYATGLNEENAYYVDEDLWVEFFEEEEEGN